MIQYLDNAILCGQRTGNPAIVKRLDELHDHFAPFALSTPLGDFLVLDTLKGMGRGKLKLLFDDPMLLVLGVCPMTGEEIDKLLEEENDEVASKTLNSIFKMEPLIRDLMYYTMGFDVRLQYVEITDDVRRDESRMTERVDMVDYMVNKDLMFWLNRFKYHTVDAKTIETLFTTGYCEDFANMLKGRFGGIVVPTCDGHHYVLDLDGVAYDVHGPIFQFDDRTEC